MSGHIFKILNRQGGSDGTCCLFPTPEHQFWPEAGKWHVENIRKLSFAGQLLVGCSGSSRCPWMGSQGVSQEHSQLWTLKSPEVIPDSRIP